MKTIDARGISCPEPVIRTKNALALGENAYTVMVDNVTAKENVSRFALHQGYQVETYIATFYSHFGAMSFKKKCDKEGYTAVIMPVPRNLSSSCGTCVKFTGNWENAENWKSDELEQLAKIRENGMFAVIWHS